MSVRIEPVIFELERARSDILVVAQSSVLRCLLAYLQGIKPHEIPYIEVHEGELIECAPDAYGVRTTRHKFWDPTAKRAERDAVYEKQQHGSHHHSRGAGKVFEEDEEEEDEQLQGSKLAGASAAAVGSVGADEDRSALDLATLLKHKSSISKQAQL